MLADLSTLIQQCAPDVGPVTMRAIIKTESSGQPFILADAGPANLPWSQRKSMVRSIHPRSAQEAAQLAAQLIANGHIVAIGLTQINAKNLPRLGLTIEQVLDPCTNIRAGARILSDFYASALRRFGPADKQAALQAAISSYWSGNFFDGFTGGYVQQVMHNAGLAVELKIPSLAPGSILPSPHGVYQVDRSGRINPYSAPLQAGAAVPVTAYVDPRRSPLEAPGFKTTSIAQQ